MSQLSLFTDPELKIDDWTFNNAPTRDLTHCYHDYPARMIPQVAAKLLTILDIQSSNILFDPYCGTGTSLVEGFIRGIRVIGTDLNPLARLISRAKLTLLSIDAIDRAIRDFRVFMKGTTFPLAALPTGINIEFWFKPNVIQKLQQIKTFINQLSNNSIELFFQVAFSETVRECSNTRLDEFKLYRLPIAKLQTFSPDVINIMNNKLSRNRLGLMQLIDKMSQLDQEVSATVYDFNTVESIPDQFVPPNSVDIVITSPPYGDSRTTVAYGQYSRLSAEWLNLGEPSKVDIRLMGGSASIAEPTIPSQDLQTTLSLIHTINAKRAQEVVAFYSDLWKSIQNVANVIKPQGYACYVVGNRTVKGISLPTDLAIQDFFKQCGFSYVTTYHRQIPNKRMPTRNSPSNKTGATETTMLGESIVIMQKNY